MNKITLIKIEDTGANLVKIDSGEFLIDGKRITIPYRYNGGTEIVVNDPYDIRQISSNSYTSHYEDLEGNTLSVDGFEQDLIRLKSKGESVYGDDEEEYNLEFKDLDDEYAYRKYCRKWKVVSKTKETIGEPIPVFEQLIKLNTGNEFINSLFTVSDVDAEKTLYTYRRNEATRKIVEECFTKLGMVYSGNCNYGKTEGSKIWGSSGHSHLEYVVAYGRYVFSGDRVSFIKGSSDLKGSLESLQKQCASDKKYLETIIESGYKVHFRNPEITGMLLGDVISEVAAICSSVSSLEVKQKSVTSQRSVNTKLATLLTKLRQSAQES